MVKDGDRRLSWCCGAHLRSLGFGHTSMVGAVVDWTDGMMSSTRKKIDAAMLEMEVTIF